MMPNQTQDLKPDHISVCICTFHRPELLSKALAGVTRQVTESAFTFEVVVVDNDHRRSAEEAVRLFQSINATKVIYDCEPEQNIALARNKAIRIATGNLIAFIDDDEYPVEEWLIRLYHTIMQYKADGVLGPVLPHFNGNPPEWLIRGKFCERKSDHTGKILHWDDTRTGNVLLNKLIFNDANCRFDQKYGRSGGEDIDFFKKSIKSGRKFIWCNESPVYETIPPERWTVKFYFRKNFRIGGISGEIKRKENGKLRLFLKVVAASVLYLFLLPIGIFVGRHFILKYMFKLTYNVGWFLGFCNIQIRRDR
jgi:glycosyltransferase involved in cell wall biosynthesis